ncbi:UDP-N-acetylglucosamine 2-epimerase [Leeuwenhoekiella aequorea]|uniref:UDP-N-acetylglucosamine 2-epimerase n=1 Tax=Leeuwenhoekiella aequorea TaxID=283736 RepID=UPI00352D1CA0|tara:strand:- start:11894 stop:13066 length:1173 start_codon:yes stop_codon:yes gene_type:complete
MRKIAVITGTRAEYGLLRPLMQAIKEDEHMHLQVVVTGTHLAPEFGMTVHEIEDNDFFIDKKVECILSSDTVTSVTKSIGIALLGFTDVFDSLKPDIIVLLGDRTEILAAAIAALIANIPIAHIHGGEVTEGAYDESIRHAITKMSHLHFASAEVYRKRIIQLGESPDNVFNVGAIGLDSIKSLKLLNKRDFEQAINFKLAMKNVLVTFHPVTMENQTAKDQFQEIIDAIHFFEKTHVIFTYANSDRDGQIINQMIDQYVIDNPQTSISFKSLGQLRYLSALKHIDAVVGNSSSGIIEAPYFGISTVNIGDRQKGRILHKSVIQTAPNKQAIIKSLEKVFKNETKEQIAYQKHLFGNGAATVQIMKILKNTEKIELKKKFNDLNFKYENE